MTRLDTATVRRLAVKASVDPRSVQREIREPGSVRGLAGHRIRDALRELGLAHLVGMAPAPIATSFDVLAGRGPIA